MNADKIFDNHLSSIPVELTYSFRLDIISRFITRLIAHQIAHGKIPLTVLDGITFYLLLICFIEFAEFQIHTMYAFGNSREYQQTFDSSHGMQNHYAWQIRRILARTAVVDGATNHEQNKITVVLHCFEL